MAKRKVAETYPDFRAAITKEERDKIEDVTTSLDREFFKFAGNYCVAPDTTDEEMATDASCFLDSAEGMLDKLIDDFGPGSSVSAQAVVFGVRHFVIMAKNLCQALQYDLERQSDAHTRQAGEEGAGA